MRGKQEHSGTVLIDGKNENLQECFLSYRRLSLAGDPLDLLPAVGTKPAVRGAAGASGSLGRGRNQAFDLRPSGASSCKGKKKRAGITALKSGFR